MDRRSFLAWLGFVPVAVVTGAGKPAEPTHPPTTPRPNGSDGDTQAVSQDELEPTPLSDHLQDLLPGDGRGGPNRIAGIRTHFCDLDDLTGGFHRGDLILIAGRPSMGKSALALNIALRVALGSFGSLRTEQPMPVLFVSMENSKPVLARNLLCSYAGADTHRLRRGLFGQKQMLALRAKAADLSRAPIHIEGTPGLPLGDLRALAVRTKCRFPELSLIAADSVDGIEEPAIASPQAELPHIARGLKALARELDVPIIVTSGLTPRVEEREGCYPRLCDLPGHGLLHRHADLVILLYRAEYYSPGEQPGEADLIIAKNRRGSTGIVRLAFQHQCMRFTDLLAPDQLL